MRNQPHATQWAMSTKTAPILIMRAKSAVPISSSLLSSLFMRSSFKHFKVEVIEAVSGYECMNRWNGTHDTRSTQNHPLT